MTRPARVQRLSSSLDEVRVVLEQDRTVNAVPVFATLPADLLTPTAAYLRLTEGCRTAQPSYLLESVVQGTFQGRYSFVGTDPVEVIRTGQHEERRGDPLVHLQTSLDRCRPAVLPGTPPFTGGAVGFVGYDCVRHFDPVAFAAAPPLADPLSLPESVFLICKTLVVFDHLHRIVQIVSHVSAPEVDATSPSYIPELTRNYEAAAACVARLEARLTNEVAITEPPQPPIQRDMPPAQSNIGRDGYEAHVTRLKSHIVRGDIIQAVPSQRLSRPTELHAFNAYRHLRRLNPSPYMFYIDCGEGLQLVGASPECLCKIEGEKVFNHAIAGTIRRGSSLQEDERLAAELAQSGKDAAEHVMLVDLARNDVNRVCEPASVVIDSFMEVERFSHVMHLTSQVSGTLRPGKTRWDAFRSIFPAGTVSGAPKIRAMQLISELEGEKRGVYAGAVGRWNFGTSEMDTCIAIRTMVFSKGAVHLQAGGGIVYESDEYEEYIETLNKLASNLRALEAAEQSARSP